jgi:hypothetical protein
VRRRTAAVVALLAVVSGAGCGGQDETPAGDLGGAPSVATAHVKAQATAADAVDTTMTVEAVLDPATDLPVPVPAPAGTRTVAIVIGWRDAGRMPLPWERVRFALVDDHGGRTDEQFRVPPQRIRRGSTSRLDARVVFALPEGVRARRLEMRSLSAGEALRAQWGLHRPGK